MDLDIRLVMIRLTAVGMVVAYLLRLKHDLDRRPHDPDTRKRLNRQMIVLWAGGYAMYLLHIYVAFAAYHDWSHAAAYEHTAQRTAELTGWSWGGGLWINYAIALWWPLDILWCWRRGIDRLPGWYVVSMHVVLSFVVFNATVVFGPVWWRWFVPLLAFLLIGYWWRSPGITPDHPTDRQIPHNPQD